MRVLFALLVLVPLAGGLALACGAGSAIPPVAKVDEAAMFAAALAQCAPLSSTRAADDACRAGVEKAYCGPGGPLASSAGCSTDGGGE